MEKSLPKPIVQQLSKKTVQHPGGLRPPNQRVVGPQLGAPAPPIRIVPQVKEIDLFAARAAAVPLR